MPFYSNSCRYFNIILCSIHSYSFLTQNKNSFLSRSNKAPSGDGRGCSNCQKSRKKSSSNCAQCRKSSSVDSQAEVLGRFEDEDDLYSEVDKARQQQVGPLAHFDNFPKISQKIFFLDSGSTLTIFVSCYCSQVSRRAAVRVAINWRKRYENTLNETFGANPKPK